MSLAQFPKKQPEPMPRDWRTTVHEIKIQLRLPITEGLQAVPDSKTEARKLARSIDLDGFFNYLSRVYSQEEMLVFTEKILEILKREDNNPLFSDERPLALKDHFAEQAKLDRMQRIVTGFSRLYATEVPMADLITALNDLVSYQYVDLKKKIPVTLNILLFTIKAEASKKFEAELEHEIEDKRTVDIISRQKSFERLFEYLRRKIAHDLSSSISLRKCESLWFDILNNEGRNLITARYDPATGNFDIGFNFQVLNKISTAVQEQEDKLRSDYYTFRQSKNGAVPDFIIESLAEWCLLAQVELLLKRKRGVKVDDSDLEFIRNAYTESLKVLQGESKAFKLDYSVVIHGIKGVDGINGIVKITEKYDLPEFREDDSQISRYEIKRLRQYLLNELLNNVLDRHTKVTQEKPKSQEAQHVTQDLNFLTNLINTYENAILRWTGTLSRSQYKHNIKSLADLANRYGAQQFIQSEDHMF
ncbi:hypothetical protein HY570_00025 [Candidatus Micrarchaeota archaeon]|nr:hypothetical protein [Candidatus Micrarchaeota archaeon]